MLSAKYYIKDKEELQEYQCSACFEVNYELLICEGACKKQYCKYCFKQNGYQGCRFCGDQLKGIYLPLKKVEFVCPGINCKAILKSPQQFDHHCDQCLHLSKEIRSQFYYKLNFMCSKGHRLSSNSGRGSCCICLESYYISKCAVCFLNYCTNCRPPPCSKRQCAIGHDLKPNIDRGTITCDLCAISICDLSEKRVFSDRECNFDICLACHAKLPEEHPLPEFKIKRRRVQEEVDMEMKDQAEQDESDS